MIDFIAILNKIPEGDMDDPENSSIFKNYPEFMKKKEALTFLTDSFRTIISTKIQLDDLLEAELVDETVMALDKAIKTDDAFSKFLKKDHEGPVPHYRVFLKG